MSKIVSSLQRRLKYDPKNSITLIIIFIILISTTVAVGFLQKQTNISNHAASNTSTNDSQNNPPQQALSPDLLSDSFLIRIKSSSKNLIKDSPKPEDTGIASLNALNKTHGLSKFEQIAKSGKNSKKDSSVFGWYKVTLNTSGTLKKTIKKDSSDYFNIKRIMDSYKQDPNINAVEPDYVVSAFLTPNDPYYSSTGSWGQTYPDLWGTQKIKAASAWDQATGSTSVVIASIDTGVDRNHEDLKDNMWVNTVEVPNNGIDDDGNGYIDDYYGWNWVANSNDPMDDHGHGTHTAGTIAATGNNSIGIVGVNWTSRIMALKFLDSNGSGNLDNGIKALQYAADMGARVSSNSWGCMCNSLAMDDAVQYEHDRGMVTAVAAGNNNGDSLDFSPASADMAITVSASDYTDAKASFSNWGEKIDVAAPGVNILSTKASINRMCSSTTNYCRVSGTSMATPHVAGLAALIISKNPTLTNEEVRQIIRTGADDLGTPGKDSSFGYGRINAATAIGLSDTRPLSPIITSLRSRAIIYGTSLQIKGSVPGSNFASYKLEAGAGRAPSAWTPLVTTTTQVINDTLAIIDTTKLSDGFYIFRLTAMDTNGKTYQFQVNDIEVDNFNAIITSPAVLISQGIINIFGTAQTKNSLSFSGYKLEWGLGAAPLTWSASGITLSNNGLQPVDSSQLGTWDTSSLTNGQTYTLRLSVTGSNGAISIYSVVVIIDKDIVSGWPKNIPNVYGSMAQAAPVFADLDGDGIKEVVITAPANKIYVFRKDGSDFPGFPVTVGTGEIFIWPANVDDLDGDGKKEIMATAVTAQTLCTGCGKIYIIKSDGTFYPGWPNPINFISQQAGDATPVIADLDGDGKKELISIDSYRKQIHAYRLDGSELAGFPKAIPLVYPSGIVAYSGTPMITDLDHDGKSEIAYGSQDKFYLFDNDGSLLPGWPYTALPYNGYSVRFGGTSAVGDIDGDGNLEIVAIGYVGSSTVNSGLYIWKKDGTLMQGWPKDAGYLTNGYSPLNSPVVADTNGDGKDEIAVGLNTINIFNIAGQIIQTLPVGANITSAVSDVNGDGKLDFVGLRYNWIQIGNGNSIYWQRMFPGQSSNNVYGTRFDNPAVIADLDNNGKMELAVTETKYAASATVPVYLWELPAASAKYEWPMIGHDQQRTGRLDISASPNPTPSTPTSTPPSDTTPPSVSITNPLNGTTIIKKSTVSITANASDNMGVIKVEFYINSKLTCTDTSIPYFCSWKVPAVNNKAYKLQAKAYDAANNNITSFIVTVTAK